MSEAATIEVRERVEAAWPRSRLSGLMILVFAVGVALGLVSRARGFDREDPFFEEAAVLHRGLGAALLPIAIVLILVVAGQVKDCWRAGAKRVWPLAWRGTALVLLVAFVAWESSLLRVVSPSDWAPGRSADGMGLQVFRAWLRALPTVGGLMMIGLVLGLRPRRPGRPARRFWASTWLSVILASVAGVVIVATAMPICYLVLIAIETIGNALRRPGEGFVGQWMSNPPKPFIVPSLAERLDAALPAVGLAMMACLITAGWLGTSLRRAGENESDKHSQRDLWIGLVLAAVLAGAARWLVVRTFAAIQPIALEGLALTIGAGEIGIPALGFAIFAAGLVAHALTPAEGPPKSEGPSRLRGPRWMALVLMKTSVAIALGLVILAGLDKIAARFEPLDEVLPVPFVDEVLEPIRLHGAGVWSVLEGSGWPAMLTWEASAWFPALAVVWLTWRSLGLLTSAQSARPTPFDRVFDSPASTRRFLGFWTALSALFLAALPALALAGLIALHHVLAIFVP